MKTSIAFSGRRLATSTARKLPAGTPSSARTKAAGLAGVSSGTRLDHRDPVGAVAEPHEYRNLGSADGDRPVDAGRHQSSEHPAMYRDGETGSPWCTTTCGAPTLRAMRSPTTFALMLCDTTRSGRRRAKPSARRRRTRSVRCRIRTQVAGTPRRRSGRRADPPGRASTAKHRIRPPAPRERGATAAARRRRRPPAPTPRTESSPAPMAASLERIRPRKRVSRLRAMLVRTARAAAVRPAVTAGALSIGVSLAAAAAIAHTGSLKAPPILALLAVAGAVLLLSFRPEALLLSWLALAPFLQGTAVIPQSSTHSHSRCTSCRRSCSCSGC